MIRYHLQIQFKNNNDSFFISSWDINEPFDNLKECEKMAIDLMDCTVSKMRIVDVIENKICKQFVIKKTEI